MLFIDLDDVRIREGQRITETIFVAMRDRLASAGVDFLVLVIPTIDTYKSNVLCPECK